MMHGAGQVIEYARERLQICNPRHGSDRAVATDDD